MANGDDDLVRVVARAKALQDFLATENGANLLAGYKRAGNILAAEEKKSGKKFTGVNAALFEAAEEKQLATALTGVTAKADEALNKETYGDAMAALATLRAPVDAFFDKVMVNAENPALRETRLGLLNELRSSVQRIADFSQIEG
jgi:glycyl-tRNA synthetase beta chain